MKSPVTIATLIEGCRRGDRRFQRELVDRFSPRLYAIARRYLPDEAHAQDVLQDSLVKILTRIEQYQGSGSFEGWMRQVVVGTALNRLDRKWMRREVCKETVYLDGSVDPFVLDDLSTQDIMACVRELPEGYRHVFNLYAIEGYRHREIAQMMGISEATSRTHYARARALLRSVLTSPKFGLRHVK